MNINESADKKNKNKNKQHKQKNPNEAANTNANGNGISVKNKSNFFGGNNYNKKHDKNRRQPDVTNANNNQQNQTQPQSENSEKSEKSERMEKLEQLKREITNSKNFASQQNQASFIPKNKNKFDKKQKNINKNAVRENKENIINKETTKFETKEKFEEFKDYTDDNTDEIINITTAEDFKAKIAEPVETGPTVEIVGIRFKPVGKIYFFAPNGINYSANDKIIVETSRGLELGYVVIPNKNIGENKVVQPLKHVLRKATEEDAERSEKNKITAKETIKIANDRIKFHNLDTMKMKLIEAEYTFDNSKLIYYFTADGRVDFRELVKDLAAIFKTRIEMRQIGIRDQTKILGGLSICGRPFCCNSFLQDFAQVTIKMAKEQNMSINSAKISGACGRLMCCLKYEHEAYEYLSKDTPKINSIVEASSGETGIIIDSNLMTGICKVKVNQKNSSDNDNPVKPFPKKNLKVIGFMKNEQEHLYNAGDKE